MSGAAVVNAPNLCEVADTSAVDRVQARLAQVCGQVNALHGELVELVGEALELGLWGQDGVHSPAQWLAWQTGLSAGRASDSASRPSTMKSGW